jgi:uncharacterized membrane protein
MQKGERYMSLAYKLVRISRISILSIGVIIIFLSAFRSFFKFFQGYRYKKDIINDIRLEFGKSLMLGLEFIIGADIIGSIVKPDYYEIGILSILVIIRTVLSYFLNKELNDINTHKQG